MHHDPSLHNSAVMIKRANSAVSGTVRIFSIVSRQPLLFSIRLDVVRDLAPTHTTCSRFCPGWPGDQPQSDADLMPCDPIGVIRMRILADCQARLP